MLPEELRLATAPIKDDAKLLVGELQAIDETLALIRANEQDEARLEPLLAHLRHFFLTDLSRHMLDEESVFFPAVERLPSGYWKVVRLKKEHTELREAIEGFRSALALEGYLGPQTKQQQLWRLAHEAGAILRMLRSHAEFEIELMKELEASVADRPGGR
jgi:iron-sulfur cluster repair protein YtfE (RIC family)